MEKRKKRRGHCCLGSVRRLGGDTEYSLADLPIKHVLDVTHFREAQK